MEVKRKRKGSSNGNNIYNTEMLQSRVMCFSSVGQISLEDLFFYEFSPFPKSIFTVTPEVRFPKSKAALKNKLNLLKRTSIMEVIIVDGCA